MVTPGADRLANLLIVLESERPLIAAHSRRVACYAVRLASQYGVSEQALEAIRTGALLHDAGKLAIPSPIVHKTGHLTPVECRTLRMHPEVGVELAKRAGLAAEACQIVLSHHERWDGGGYPDRLSGRSIPWAARLVSVMDAFDALLSANTRLTIDAARGRLEREAGKRFCPWVVASLMAMPASLLEAPVFDVSPAWRLDGYPSRAALGATKAWTAGSPAKLSAGVYCETVTTS